MNQRESRAWFEDHAHKYTRKEITKILNRSHDSVTASLRYYKLTCKDYPEVKPGTVIDGKFDKPDLTRNPSKLRIRNDHKGKKLVSIGYKGLYTYVPVDATKEEVEQKIAERVEYHKRVEMNPVI